MRALEEFLMHLEVGSLPGWWPCCICIMLKWGHLWDCCVLGCPQGTSGQAKVAAGRCKRWHSAPTRSVSCWGPLGTTESSSEEAENRHIRKDQKRRGQPHVIGHLERLGLGQGDLGGQVPAPFMLSPGETPFLSSLICPLHLAHLVRPSWNPSSFSRKPSLPTGL